MKKSKDSIVIDKSDINNGLTFVDNEEDAMGIRMIRNKYELEAWRRFDMPSGVMFTDEQALDRKLDAIFSELLDIQQSLAKLLGGNNEK